VLSRPFLTLAFAMFTAMMGIGMVTPILPVYAEAQGASGYEIGLAFSSFAIVQLFISPFAGRIADRYGRKLFIVIGLASYVVTALGWYYTDTVFWTIAFRAFSGIGSALIFALSQAYVGDLAPEGFEGRYMGAFGIFIASGFGVGPLLAGIIRDQYDIATVFISMAVMFTAASTAVAVLLPKSKRIRTGGIDQPPAVPWSTILKHPYVQGLYLVGTSLAFAMGASFTFVAIYLEEEFAATATMVGAVLAVQQVTNGAMQPLSGMLADRLNRRALILGGAILVSIGYLTPAVVDEYWLILVGFMLGVGIGSSIAQVSTQALQVDIGRGLGMATVMSLQSTSFGSGVLMGSMLTGIVADAVGTRWVFIVASLVILGGALAFILRTAGHPVTRFGELEQPPAEVEATSG
jgi:MFS transporter, DHA1 family, multidrug resistance protein